jgi:hypothetical protein
MKSRRREVHVAMIAVGTFIRGPIKLTSVTPQEGSRKTKRFKVVAVIYWITYMTLEWW